MPSDCEQKCVDKLYETACKRLFLRYSLPIFFRHNDGNRPGIDLPGLSFSFIIRTDKGKGGAGIMDEKHFIEEQMELLKTIIEQQKAYIQSQDARLAEKDATIADDYYGAVKPLFR